MKEPHSVIVIPIPINRDTQPPDSPVGNKRVSKKESKGRIFYIFKDCTFNDTSMVVTGGADSMNGTVVFRDSNSDTVLFVNGGMEKETFLGEVRGKNYT